MKKACWALALLLATGCTTVYTDYWCHSTKDMLKEFPKDRYECEGDAYVRARDRGEEGDKKIIEEEWTKCMRARGWSPCANPKQ